MNNPVMVNDNNSRSICNFSAGPAFLPESVLNKVQEAIKDFNGTGLSIFELSHRSKFLDEIYDNFYQSLTALVTIPSNYSVLLLPGGATVQFSMLPLNLLAPQQSAGYLMTGEWSTRSYLSAKKYYPVTAIPINTDSDHNDSYCLDKKFKYLHVTSNETADGVEWRELPKTADLPLVADMSSSILTKPISITDYGAIYASCQKNLGIAGLALIIINEDLFNPHDALLPDIFNYRKQLEKKSTYNTPLLLSWYTTSCVLQWIAEEGGLTVMNERNAAKAALLYDYLDHSHLFKNDVHPAWRSRINIVFNISSNASVDHFIDAAKKEGFINITGHHSQGGLRVSFYNSIELSAVKKFVSFLENYETLFYRNHQ